MKMEILETMGKIAGIGGLALGVFLLLFKEVIRKSIFASLTRDQSYKLIRLILILVWSVAIVGIASWFFAPLLSPAHSNANPPATNTTANPPTASKLIVTMDSPLRVYDRENDGTGRINTDEIVNALKDLPGVTLHQITTNADFERDEEAHSKNPELVILHMSAFARQKGSHDEPEAVEKLIRFLRYMKDLNTQFLIYTRNPLYADKEMQKGWIAQIEGQIPELKNRIQFFDFVPGKPERFRDPEVQRELKMRVRTLLKIA